MSLLASLTAEARAELDALIDARIAAALAARDREPAKRWLSPDEAAAYFGTTTRAIYARKARGRIPVEAVKYVGRRWLLDREVLDRAIERS